jgi:hypothetical protein
MRSTISNVKRPSSVQDIAAEQWSRLYVDIRASYGRASIQSALLLNGGASVALLAFLGNLAIAQQSRGLPGNFVAFKESFVCFGAGVMLAATSSVVAFLIQIVRSHILETPKAGPAFTSDYSELEWWSHRFFFLQLASLWQQARSAICSTVGCCSSTSA